MLHHADVGLTVWVWLNQKRRLADTELSAGLHVLATAVFGVSSFLALFSQTVNGA
jgi:hypothetical protein